MQWVRVWIFGIPLAALGISAWSGWQAHASRQQSRDALVSMLAGPLPALNPFAPASEAEAEIIDLLHAPLLRIDDSGKLAPDLAERWSWHQEVTCWFANAETAESAAQRLQALNGNAWVTWQLDSAQVHGAELTLRFSDPNGPGADEALKSIADLKPLPVSFCRVRAKLTDRSLLQSFVALPENAAEIKRLWFDGDGTCEIITTITPPVLERKLAAWLQTQGQSPLRVQPLAEVTALLEPVLEFHLRPEARWNDGAPVTAVDVKETVKRIQEQQWPVPNLEAFRHIQSIEGAENLVRIIYRKRHGAAVMSWSGLPILPAVWLSEHPGPIVEPPPGAGLFQAARRDSNSLLLKSTAKSGTDSLEFLTPNSPMVTQAGLFTQTLDVLWSGQPGMQASINHPDMRIRHTAPRTRLLVLWNTKAPSLTDVRVRKALALATDRPALIRDLLQGKGQLEDGLFQPNLWFAQKPAPTDHAPDEAAALLTQAGWLKDVDGIARKPGQTLEIELLTTAGNPQREELAKMLAEQWRKAGVVVKITALPQAELINDRLSIHRFDAAILGQDFETSWDVTSFWHSSQTDPGGLNFSGISDPQIDLLIEALAEEFDPERVTARAHLLEDRLLELRPILPLFSGVQEVNVRASRLPDSMLHDPQKPFSLKELLTAPIAVKSPDKKMEVKMLEPKE